MTVHRNRLLLYSLFLSYLTSISSYLLWSCIAIIWGLLFISCEEDIFAPKTFEGIWNATEYDDKQNENPFIVEISYYQGNTNRIMIGNFSALAMEYKVIADISGLDLTIHNQEVDGRGGLFRISGTGKAKSNLREINWSYKVDDDVYTAVFKK